MSGNSLLDLLDDDARAELLSHGITRTYPRRSFLVHEGEESQLLLIVRSGLLKITKTHSSGRNVLIDLRGPGAVLGELSAFGDGARSATVSTVTETEVLTVPGERLVEMVDTRPDVARSMVRVLAERLRMVNDHLVEFGSGDAMGRIAARLLELIDDRELAAIVGAEHVDEAGPITLDLPVSQEELGEWTGLSREAVVKAFRRMRDLGWIETDRRHVVLLDVPALRLRAGSEAPLV